MPGSGLLAATVPGAWDGWLTLLRDHGTKSLRDVLDRAIGYARDGFPLRRAGRAHHRPRSRTCSATTGRRPPRSGCRTARCRLRAAASATRSSPTPGSGCWPPPRPRARDREAQIEAARRAWSQGFVAAQIDEFCRTAFRDDSGRDHAGVLTGADMASWEATYEDARRPPTSASWSLVKAGAWTQGPVLAQQLRLLEGCDLSYVDGKPTAETVHLAVEAAKLAFADREAWYGDIGDVPLDDAALPRVRRPTAAR